jgi:hypothetical protein
MMWSVKLAAEPLHVVRTIPFGCLIVSTHSASLLPSPPSLPSVQVSPERLNEVNVDDILRKYKGREGAMIRNLEGRYHRKWQCP